MSLLSTPSIYGDQVILRQQFLDRRMVQDSMGVLVGCTVGRYGPGIMPTAASSRVTYDRTRSALINHNKMTIRVRFKMFSTNNASAKRLITKCPNLLTDNQFFLQFNSNRILTLYLASSAADFANNTGINALTLSQTYTIHVVYDGSLAANNRAAWYVDGAAVAFGITGTLPTSMRASASPIALFNHFDSNNLAPDTDFTLYDFCIWNKALSAADVALDAADRTYLP